MEAPMMTTTTSPDSVSRPLLALVLLLAALTLAPDASARRKADPVDAERSAPVVRNTVDELRQLMDAQQLTELRTTYNGTYGASLLFNASTLQYYASLFQGKEFWRVIKTDSVENAEKVYDTFVQQTRDLAQVNIDTIRLEAGKRYTESLVAYNEQRLRSLQQEADLQRQQSQQVSTAIQQAKQQAVSLSTDLRSSNSQLDQLNQRIQALQAQQGNLELALPTAPTQAASTAHPVATEAGTP
jgi:hypothetical protein